MLVGHFAVVGSVITSCSSARRVDICITATEATLTFTRIGAEALASTLQDVSGVRRMMRRTYTVTFTGATLVVGTFLATSLRTTLSGGLLGLFFPAIAVSVSWSDLRNEVVETMSLPKLGLTAFATVLFCDATVVLLRSVRSMMRDRGVHMMSSSSWSNSFHSLVRNGRTSLGQHWHLWQREERIQGQLG